MQRQEEKKIERKRTITILICLNNISHPGENKPKVVEGKREKNVISVQKRKLKREGKTRHTRASHLHEIMR